MGSMCASHEGGGLWALAFATCLQAMRVLATIVETQSSSNSAEFNAAKLASEPNFLNAASNVDFLKHKLGHTSVKALNKAL